VILHRLSSGKHPNFAKNLSEALDCVCSRRLKFGPQMPRSIMLPGGFDCAQFCAPPHSRTIAIGSTRAMVEITATGAENQHDSEPSHSVLIVFGRSLNQRVVGSSPTRFTTPFSQLQAISKWKVRPL